MAVRVVCISRTLAAGGEEIGQGVAERLGYRVIDAEIIQRAAEKADVQPERVARTEQRQSLIRRLISSIAFAEPSGALAAGILRRLSRGCAWPSGRPWRNACAR